MDASTLAPDDRWHFWIDRGGTFTDIVAKRPDGTLFGAPDRPLEATIAALVRLPGIGRWTAEYIALRGLGYADAFPTGDLGLVRAWSRLARRTASAADLDRRAATWRPYRGYAAMLLWSLA